MDFGLSLFQSSAITEKAVQNILRENDVSRHYGLELSEKQAAALVETRNKALRDTGRVEIGGGVIDKMMASILSNCFSSMSISFIFLPIPGIIASISFRLPIFLIW